MSVRGVPKPWDSEPPSPKPQILNYRLPRNEFHNYCGSKGEPVTLGQLYNDVAGLELGTLNPKV